MASRHLTSLPHECISTAHATSADELFKQFDMAAIQTPRTGLYK